jgi:hypothetical protein
VRLLWVAFAVCVTLGVSGCGPSSSPRLEAIRPHLKRGADRKELIQQIGLKPTNGDADEIVEKKQIVVFYDLDGSKKGMRLKLAFAGKKLAYAAVVRPGADGKFTEVDEVIVPEQEP